MVHSRSFGKQLLQLAVVSFLLFTSNQSFAQDADGDGIVNNLDIDDDNDGVLDAVESPGCFFSTANWNNSPKSDFVTITSELGLLNPNTSLSGLTDGNGVNSAVQYTTAIAQSQLNKALFKMEFLVPTQLDAIYIQKTSATQLFAATAASLKVQGSNDNTTWTDLTAAIACPANATNITANGSVSLTNSNEFVLTTNAGAYKYYRIYGVAAANVLAGIATEFYFDVNVPAYQASLFPKSACSNDTDGDNIVNHLDLDSDGDNCSDAVEAGSSTTATSTTVFPTGTDTNANGLLNTYEGGTAGTINYTSSYSPYAIGNNWAACVDTDADGINDVLDIDDDNDGVLDAVEAASCYMAANDWNTSNKTLNATISSQLNTLAPNTDFSALTDNDGAVAAVQFSTAVAQAQLNKELFKVTFSQPVRLDALYIKKTSATQIFAATASSIKLQGSNDNLAWTDLTAAIASPANATNITANGGVSLTNSNKFTVTTNAGNYKYYRVYGVLAANILAGIASEFYFDVNTSTYVASNFPLTNCTVDTDNDGTLNQLDLDADGDACSDAKEAGATNSSTSNYQFTGAVGANGLINSLETSTESGLVTYTETYGLYAADNTINGCTDTDGDNITDVNDIDDDNDGVLDANEINCSTYAAVTDFYGPTYWSSITWTGGAYTAVYPTATPYLYIDGNLTNGVEVFRPGTTANPIAGDDFTATPIIFTLKTTAPLHADGFSIVNDYGALGDNIVKADIKLFSGTAPNYTLLGTETIDNMLDVSSTTRYPFSTGYDNVTSIQILVYKTTPGGTQPENGMQMGELGLYSNAGTFCIDIDTDLDGIVNRLDLDSDDDSCSDAVEAGSSTTATSTSAFPAGTDTNANGLLNNYEGGTAGTINYTNVYSTYALSSNLASCADTDGDGITNNIDIDDDNDGVLDAAESPTCFYTSNDWYLGPRPEITVTTPLSMAIGQNFPERLVNGFNAATNFDVRFLSTTASINTLGTGSEVYRFNMQIPVELSNIYLGYVNTNTHFLNATTLVLRGSSDGQTWTNLSLPLVYDASIGAPSATEVTTIPMLPNINNANLFTVTQNAAKYQYYDIYWTTGGGISNAGYANEVYFKTAAGYIPSQHPKISCNTDTDGDGILNHQDLDSDADGCADAKEAGVSGTLTAASALNNAIAAGPYNANGFANALQTSGNGIYTGTYTYNNARNGAVNGCTDSDNDGVPNISDIDDDNDGVLDLVECTPPGIEPLVPRFDLNGGTSVTQTISGFPDELYIDIWNIDNNFNLKINNVNITTVSELNFAIGSTYTVAYTNVVQQSGLGLNSPNNVWLYGNNQSRPMIRVVINSFGEVKILGLDGTNGTGNYQELVLLNAAYNVVPINLNGTNIIAFSQNNEYPPTYLNAEFNTYRSSGSCDFDNDGVDNTVDLDSDNDGCSDALEAKTTTSTVANYQFTGTFGSNGFLNTLETAIDNGVYNGLYPYDYAINASVLACLDSDNDGVFDLTDLDDDNDGVLDAIESPTCFYSLTELATPASATSDLNPLLSGGITYGPSNSIDNSTTTYAAYISGQSITNKELYKYTANGLIAISALNLDLFSWPISTNGTSTFKLQGSGDNVLWTDLSAPLASTGTTGTLTISNTLAPTSKFKYFRLLGIAGTCGIGGITNVTFVLATSTNPSENPKNACTNDTDGDNIVNHLDVDSDNDGCFDVVEAGVLSSSTTGIVAGTGNANYGANGFANSIETATESGIFTGVYVYNYAVSATTNACLDTDNDGVKDVSDIDDDNDGVLDATESPACFITATDWNTASKSDYIKVSSDLDLLSPNTNLAGLVDGIGGTAAVQYVSAQSQLNKELLKIELLVPTQLDAIYIKKTSATQLFSATAATLKVQGSNNNTTWTDLTAAIACPADATNITANGSVSLTNSNKFVLTTNPGAYKYFRIYGVAAGTVLAGIASEIYFDVNTTAYQASLLPKPACSNDTDGDNVVNHLDLDSDGDGCNDAKEAGTTTNTTANYTHLGPYGANGLANSLEALADNGIYNGTYTYNYAISTAINACIDTDSDGVPNSLDIDDDNDGVTDSEECGVCPGVGGTAQLVAPSAVTTVPVNTFGISAWGSVGIYAADGSGLSAIPTTEASLATITHSSPTLITNAAYTSDAQDITNDWLFSLAAPTDVKGVVLWTPGSSPYGGGDAPMKKVNFVWTDCNNVQFSKQIELGLPSPNAKIFYFDQPINALTSIKMDILEVWYDQEMDQGVSNGWEIATPGTINSAFNVTLGEIRFITQIGSSSVVCTTDTDNDGIPNQLDLDSDGDGCSDAIESGSSTTATSTTVYPTGTDSNGNGLNNNYEGPTAGTINYSSVYNQFAISSTANACADADGDGISNSIDIDDDNDGVLDFTEAPSCYYNAAQLANPIAVSTELAPYLTNTIGLSIDGNATTYSAFAPSVNWVGKELFNFTATDYIAISGMSFDLVNWALSSAATNTFKLQGFSTNGTWTDLSVAVASTATTGTFTINNTLAPSTKFKYYRLVGVAGTSFYGGVYTARFDFPTTFDPSLYPQPGICAVDTDNDGIPNQLDLDSDNDGCSDAIEASSSTTATSTTVYQTGTDANSNGLLNNYESATAGTINYTSTYSNYALSATLNACLDTDSDGIKDLTDIDDDNDGVLDAVESPTCFYTLLELGKPIAVSTELAPYTTNVIANSIDNSATSFSAFDPSVNWVNKEIFKFTAVDFIGITGISFDLVSWPLSASAAMTFKLQGSSDNITWSDLSPAVSSTANTGTFTIANTLATTSKFKYYRLLGVAGTSYYGGVTNALFNLATNTIPSGSPKATCSNDTDGDNIVNHLDLDSDGDGCADAIEASSSTTATSTTVYPTGTDTNTNGLLNNYESTTAGTVNYASTYTNYALTNTINACDDTDGDGITDLVDFDDDNDGVLDAVESPACFFTAVELSKPVAISSELPVYLPYVLANAIDADLVSLSGTSPSVNWTGKEIFRLTPAAPTAISGISLDLVNWPISSVAASTFKLQGTQDNTNWTDLSPALFSTATTGNLVVSNTLAPTTVFLSYRFVGITGMSGAAGVSNILFVLPTSFNSSSFPKATCTNDTDVDGKLNHQDLDSDGDGCSDARESNTTTSSTANYAHPAPHGANGFADGLETSAESGIYNGVYSYSFAALANLSVCLDTDGDGIPNVSDLDDDNDGVLDLVECPPSEMLTNGNFANGSTNWTLGSGWTITDGTAQNQVNGASGSILSQTIGMPQTVSPIGVVDVKFDVRTNNESNSAVNAVSATLALRVNGIQYALFTNQPNSTTATVVASNGATTSIGTFPITTTTGAFTNVTISIPANFFTASNLIEYVFGSTNDDFNVDNVSISSEGSLTACDTDGDGIPNSLDLDSDNDGCSDAKEAGSSTTATSTTVYPTGTDTNANGILNNYEGATAGTVNYTSTYTNYALNANLITCIDTDGDGVGNVIDLDDDNDGVLDVTELACAEQITSKVGVIVTKPATINYSFNSNTLANLVDGVDANVYVISAPTGTLTNSPLLNFEFPTPIALSYLEIGHYVGQTLFSATSTYKIQGSTDNTTWTDVTGTLTYSNVATSTSGGLSTNNSNIANFPTNTNAYKYYRVFGINAATGGGWATEVYFKQNNCSWDIDNDGIVNSLDLDSDGDGCSDAIEASSSTTATSTTVYPTGTDTNTNGLLNNYEGTTAGTVNYGSTYASYALTNTINACLDTDGDGITDVLDLDDDNDGVLDATENNCTTSIMSKTGVSVSSTVTWGGTLANILDGTEAIAAYTTTTFLNQTILQFDLPAAKVLSLIELSSQAGNFPLGSTGTYNIQGWNGTTWSTIATNQVFGTSTPITGTSNSYKFNMPNNYTAYSKYRIFGTSVSGTISGWALEAYFTERSCNPDSDGDGIPNSLELDSDNDGCADAIEAGSSTTATSTSVYPIGTDTNNNGLLNNYEGGVAGTVNYTSTYSDYALTNAINACTDTDGDGITDVLDLDDDNDGVLDVKEQTCTLTSMSKSGVSVTSTVNWTFQNAPTGLNALVDGLLIQQMYPTDVSLNNKTIFQFNLPSPKLLTLIELANNANQTPFVAGGTYKIQGSNDGGTTWIDIVVSQVVANTAPILATTNSIKFDMPNNVYSYLAYRIYGISISGQANWAQEVYFGELVCTNIDTDSDGISNRLDLDSDGDNCSDAKEAGTTTSAAANYAHPAPYGTNGLADALETTAGSGIYNGTYSYNIAISNALNGCLDTDNDGVGDIIDLDDDNDGVLDNQECSCVASLLPKTGITVSSPVTWSYGNGATSLQGLVDGVDGLIFSANTNATFTNQTILQFDLPTPAVLTQIELGNYPSQTPIVAGGIYKMQGWDGTQWGDIGINQVIANTAPINATNNSIKFNMVNNLIAFSKYRIFGVAAAGSGVWAQEAYFTQKTCNDIDTDGDGISNRLDLDSDGDGCADAIEASSSTTATSTSTYPTGADANTNGLNDNYELSTLGGSYNYTSTYEDYALSNTINACLDTDSDGITDFIDIDDDNDGVLDAAEMTACATMWTPTAVISSPFYGSSNASLTINNSGLNGSGLTATVDVPNTLTDTWYLLEPNTTGFLEYTLPANTTVGGVVLWAPDATNYGGGDGPVKDFKVEVIYNNVITYTSPTYTTAQPIGAGSNGGAQVFYLPKSFVNPQKIRLIITSGWYDVNNNNSIQVGTETIAPGTVNGAYNMTLSEFKVICAPVDIDTDGDGIPNRLDLDSDGDACADAIEAGGSITATSTSAYPSGTDANSNGLLNNYEGATSGTISYTSTYTDYALINTINMCTDSDVDGVSDFLDIDDDNDGVLDAVESPSCFLSATEWNTENKSYFTKFSSQLSPSATNNFAALGDGNATTAALQIQASQDQNNKELFKIEMMKPTQLDAIYIKKTNATQIFGTTAASLKVQGSNNNSTWTDLTAAIASPADATNITANGAVSLTNSNKFTLTSNPGAYKYFRIYGVASSNTVGGIASEFYFDVNTATYNASRYPKATCISDSDGDAVVNHLDLDSDNDGCSDANEAYNTTTAQGTDGNMYYGVGNPPATNANGAVTAATYPGTNANVLTVGTASTITVQPANQSLTAGNTATFTATVTPGSGTTTYQWQVSTNSGATWTNVTNSATYSGATTTTLTVANVALAMNGYEYHLLIAQSNYVCGNVTSNNALLNIAGLIQVVDDNVTTLEDTPLNGSVTLNDIGSGGSTVTVNTFAIDGTTYNAGQTAVIAGVGTIVINSDGTYTFTPAPNFNGNVPSISYSATDGNASTGTGTLTITVAPVNDAPIVDNEVVTTNEDAPVTGDLTDAGDSDPDGTPLTANTTPVSGPTNGTIVINADGTFTYTPNAGFSGTDVVVVSICDAGTPGVVCINDTITVTVAPVNDAPIVDNETITTNEDTPATGDLTDAGDVDPDGTALTANTTPVSGPSNGTIVINTDGTYTYTPNPNFNGTDVIVVSICDAGTPLSGVCVNDTITVTVAPVNDAPIVDNEVITTNEDTPATGDLTDAGDSDPDGTALTANTTPVSGPSNGTIVINTDGTYTYTPNPNFNGTDVIVVSICDAGLPLPGVCVNDTITVTVAPVNDAPIVDNEVITTDEDTPATGDLTDAGDVDPDGTALTANTTPVSGPSNGTIVINTDGTYTYTPAPGFNGTDEVVVSICDAGTPGVVCVNDTISITVNAVNDAPIVDNETITTNEDVPATGDLTDAGDVDPDGTPLTANTTPVSGPSNGTIVINPNGTYTYTPNPNFNGTDVIVVSICDAGTPGVVCVNDTITVTVAPVNDAPVVDNEVVTTNEDTPATGDLTDAGDSDPDGTTLTANTTPVSGPTNGTIVINANGTFTYTPNAGFSGTDVVVVSICDAGTPGVTCVNDTINITVAPVNDAPIVDNEVITSNEDAPATGDLTDAGDVDPDGTALTANTTPVSGPSNGTIVINADGTYTYTPNPNFNGTDVIVVSICDAGTPGVICVNDTINITITPVNETPIVDNEVVTTNEDTAVSGDLTDAGDVDPDGTALTANTTPVSGPSNGTIVINPNGTYTYTPNPNFSGTDVVVVSICDAGTPGVICVNDTINITITPVNETPIVDNEVVTTNEDTPATGDLTDAGDVDPDGTALTANTTPVSGPSNGTIVINTDGTFTYTPNPNFNGTDVIVVSICDAGTPGVVCVNDTITVTVAPVNDAPIVDNEVITTNEDTPATGDLTDAGDSDPDGTPLTANTTPVSGPSNGTIVINTDGTYTYTPNAGFSGTDEVVVSICDAGTPGVVCVNDTISITVNSVNDAPIVDNETITTNEDVPATGDLTDAGDVDPDGTALTANTTPVSGPSNGTIVINTDGTYTYTPNPNFNGTDVIVVSICDAGLPLPGVCVNDTITVTVAPVNDAPVVDNEVVTTNEDTPATGDLTDAGDSDPDGTPLTANTTPVSGPTNGTIVINADGTFTYTPNAGFSGTDVVVVSICDAGTPGVTCVNDTINITVAPVNDAPIVDNEVVTTNEDTPATGDLTDAGDSDPDGTPLTANTTPVSGPTNGTIVINTDGTYTYTPNPNFNGTDVIVVSICDAGTPGVICINDTINITVSPVNDAPIVDNEVINTNEDTPASGDLTDAGDSDPDGTALTANTTPVSGPSNGTIVINADGTYTYTPNAGFSGTDVVVVSICDAGTPGVTCVNDTINITVSPVNDAPIVDNEVITTPEDTAVGGDLTDAGDVDPDGTALTANTTPVSGPSNGTIVINTDGTFTYTPNPNFNGTDVIVVSICDAGTPGVVCVNDTITVTVAPVNDAPIVDNEVVTTNEDAPVTGDLTDAGDSDPDGTPLTANTTPVSGPSNGTIVINTDGTFTYTPTPGFTGTDVVVVSICDAGTPGVTCVNDTINITVAPVNDAPIVDNETITTNEDVPATGDLTDAGDVDPDGTALTANTTPVSGPSNGTIVINTDGTFTYTPNPNFNGTDVIVVSICDAGTPGIVCVNDTITVTVAPVNDAPIVDNEVITTNEDVPATGDLTDAGDVDPDGTPLTANTTPVSGPSNGTIVINTDGTYTYTPAPGFNGTDEVVVSICDAGTPGVVCVNDTISITVNAVNDAPIVDNEIITTNEDTAVSGDLTDAGDVDPDGTALTANTTPVSGPSNGTIVINTDGTYTYTPAPGFNGTDEVVVSICDAGTPGVVCVNDTISITVNSVNDAPIVDNEVVTTNEDTPVTGDLTDAGDSDPDGTPLTANTTPVSGPSNGTIVINANGTYTYTPNPNFSGTDVIVVSICDAGLPLPGICVNDTISITVNAVNDAPIVDNEITTTNEDTAVSGDLTDAGDVDPDGTALTANTTPVSGPSNGTIVINTDGTYTYTPAPGFNGTDEVVVSICDAGTPGVVCINDTISITVNAVNDAPIVDNETITTNEDTAVSGDLTDAGDVDPDGTALTANTTPVSGPSNGTIVINTDGTYTYTPAPGFNGTDEVVVSICDAGLPLPGICVNDTIFITVIPCISIPTSDCDGDGVTNGQEVVDGTSPTDPCSLLIASQTVVPSAVWNDADCDNDGSTNGEEIVNGIDPLNPDTDGDGVIDGTEIADATNALDPCSLLIASQTVTPSSAWNNADCDNDGSTNGEEIANGIDPLNPDTDGDGVIDGTEIADATNALDPCSLLIASQTVTPSIAWNNADCDNDGSTNGQEITDGTDPLNPDTDGDGVIDGTEIVDGTNALDPCSLLIASQTAAPSTAWNDADCDNDGISNLEEVNSGSNPFNSCSPVACDVVIPEAFTPDGDGINDVFVIEGIELYPNNTISIFNRWGVLVYQESNYQNNWNGTTQSTFTLGGQDLPTATYYYVFDSMDENVGVLKGYIYLQR